MGTPAETRPTILLVEDEWIVRDAVARGLEALGYVVEEAANGDEALAVLKGGCKPDLLFTDIRLPGSMDGWQLAEAARAACPDIPVIYATGYADVEARYVPRSAFLRKPYRLSLVIRAAEALGVPPWAGSSC